MNSRTRVGDGLAHGDDLVAGAERAARRALVALEGAAVDLAFVFVSGGDATETEAALLAADRVLGAHTTLGCGAHGVMGDGRGVEGDRGVTVWAGSLGDVQVRGYHLEVLRTSESTAVLGLPTPHEGDVVGVVLADPWSFPTDAFVERSYDVLGDLPLVGGLASGSGGAGATRLLLDGRVYPRGCVGVVLGGDLSVHSLVSHGCRPIGLPMTVTRSSDDMLVELAGRPAFEQARAAVAELDHHDQVAALQGLLVGLAIDEYVEEHGASDFLARTIVAADEELGTISLAGGAPVGSTVQFLLRDAAAASGELASLLDDVRCSDGGQSLAGALVFSGSSRGRDMFATPDHDVRAVREGLGIASAAGFFAAGEIGPVAGRNHLQGFTATVLAFES